MTEKKEISDKVPKYLSAKVGLINNRKMKTYTELFVWKKSMELVTNIYKDTRSFPKEEIYELTNQIRRCSVSIPSSIAEGFGRKSQTEFIRFLKISMGSLFELQTQLRISKNIEYLNETRFKALYEEPREVERMFSSLIESIAVK